MDQWSLYIDIEGFGSTYDEGTQALVSLGALMEGIYLLGSRCFPETPDRIFAYQIGDGFIIVGEFGTQSLERPLAIATALMRHVLAAGGTTRASVDEGRFADVVGCYPKIVRQAFYQAGGGAFPLGGGVMTIFPVMGPALINAHRLTSSKKAPSGSLLLIRSNQISRCPGGARTRVKGAFAVVDWIHSDYPELGIVAKQAGLLRPSVTQMTTRMRQYLKTQNLRCRWRSNTRSYLNL